LNKHFKIFITLIILSGILFPQNSSYAQPKIAILYSDLSERINEINSNKVIDVITAWELFLMQDNIPYSVIYDDDLESGIEGEYEILILPSVNIISSEQFEQLNNFLLTGNSIICSGSKLLFNQSNIDTYQNLETLFGLKDIKTTNLEKLSIHHSLTPSYINHFNLDDELLLQISNKNGVLSSNAFNKHTYPCGYIYDDNNNNSKESSILYGTIGNGRFLWAGFDLGDVIGGKSDVLSFKKVILDAINWMDKKPDVYISNYNDRISSPVIVTLQYNNALDPSLIDLLQKKNVKPSLIIKPYQKLSKEILIKFRSDEIILDLSENFYPETTTISEFVGQINRDNDLRISSILIDKKYLEDADLNLLSDVGINTVLFNELVSALPKVLNKDLLIIPFYGSINMALDRNVVNFLDYKPAINCKGNPENELLTTIDRIKSESYNFISIIELEKWWRLNNNVAAEIKYISESEIEIWLSNKNSISIADLKVLFNITKNIDRSSLSISLNNRLLEYYHDNAAGTIVIALENIPPNSLNKIKINFTLI
jgi:hypothetical protein